MQEDGEEKFSLGSALDEVRKLSRKRFGPARSFSCGHIILSLFELESAEKLSRGALSKELGIGGGSVKTLVGVLKESGLTVVDKSGNRLTDKGRDLVRALHQLFLKVVDFRPTYLRMGPFNAALFVNGEIAGAVNPIKIRDLAVRRGAMGATTLYFFDDLKIPPDEVRLSETSPEDYRELLRLGASKGQVIVICGAESQQVAKLTAVEAIMDYLQK